MAVVIGAVTPVAARAQAASDVYKKMSDVYSYAKSYQGTIVRVEKGKTPDGKSASQSVTVKISFKAPNKYLVNNVRSVNVGGKSQNTDQTMVTDGKALFMFSPDKKLYQRGQVQNENLLSRFFALLNPANGFSLLPESTVNGHAAFVLKPNLPTKGTPTEIANAKKVKINIMIDKKTYQFLKMTIDSANGNLTQSVNGQSVNGNVPDSLFAWTPPVGYKEVKPQTPSAPGAAPTAPGRPIGQ
jgi:outer membrane lipoprotein-sorting protein